MDNSAGLPLTRTQLRRLLGRFPIGTPLEPVTEERVDLGDVVREKIRYQVEAGDRVPAYLFVPQGRTAPGPAVLCLHQHNGEFHLGKSEPAGLAGNPEQHYALELARRVAADQIYRDPLSEAGTSAGSSPAGRRGGQARSSGGCPLSR